MAVTLESTIKRYIGLSNDRKPGVDPVPVGGEPAPPAGSTFFESDTGIIYRYDNGAWRTPEVGDEQLMLLSRILMELRQVSEVLQRFTGIQIG